MEDLSIIILMMFPALLTILAVWFIDFTVLFKLPRLKIWVQGEVANNKYSEFLAVENTGGRHLKETELCIQVLVYVKHEGEVRIMNLVEDVTFHNIAPGKNERIPIIESNQSGHMVGGLSTILLGGSKNEIEWKKNYYNGNVACSSDKVKVERKMVIERTEHSVHVHLFRF